MALSQRVAFSSLQASKALSRPRSVVVRAADGAINPTIKKDVEKVVDMVKVSELGKKTVYCRCWRSEKFPLCDGAHVNHNAACGDNVGPLVIENDKAQ